MTEKELLELKQKIDNAKTKVSELTGKKNYLEQELKTVWNCSSIKEAQKLQKQLEKESEELTIQIDAKVKELQEQYNV